MTQDEKIQIIIGLTKDIKELEKQKEELLTTLNLEVGGKIKTDNGTISRLTRSTPVYKGISSFDDLTLQLEKLKAFLDLEGNVPVKTTFYYVVK